MTDAPLRPDPNGTRAAQGLGNAAQVLGLIREVYEYVKDCCISFEHDDYIGSDLAYLLGAITVGGVCIWPADRPFIMLLREHFLPGHAVWLYINVEPAEREQLPLFTVMFTKATRRVVIAYERANCVVAAVDITAARQMADIIAAAEEEDCEAFVEWHEHETDITSGDNVTAPLAEVIELLVGPLPEDYEVFTAADLEAE